MDMSTVTLKGWKPGMKKVELTKVVRKHTGYGLAEGKRCTDDVLEGKEVVLSGLDSNVARELLNEVCEIGVIAEIKTDRVISRRS